MSARYIPDVKWVARNLYSKFCEKHKVKYSSCGKCPKCEKRRIDNKIFDEKIQKLQFKNAKKHSN